MFLDNISKMIDFSENQRQALWNFDGAESEAIFMLKIGFIESMDKWDLETAFWKARSIRREIDAKLQRAKKKVVMELEGEEEEKEKKQTEKQETDTKLNELEEERKTWLQDKSDDSNVKFYSKLEEFYMWLCLLMKKHGMYFREGEDNTLAVLKR